MIEFYSSLTCYSLIVNQSTFGLALQGLVCEELSLIEKSLCGESNVLKMHFLQCTNEEGQKIQEKMGGGSLLIPNPHFQMNSSFGHGLH